MRRRRFQISTPARLALAVVAIALVSAPVAVLALHQFTDVPTNHPFHKEIGAVADAGIAQGFGDGTYKPSNNVTRQAMAAFLERGVSRGGHDSDGATLGNNPGLPLYAVVANVGLDAGAAGAGSTGFVLLVGSVSASTSSPAACPCLLQVVLSVNGEPADGTEISLPGVADEQGWSRVAGTIQTMLPIGGDQSAAYQLSVLLSDSNVGSVSVDGRLSAVYIPLGPDGNDTTFYEHDCSVSESEPNGTLLAADPVSNTGCQFGSFGAAGDVDYYSVNIGSGQKLDLETRSVDGTGCSGDTMVTVEDVNATPIFTDDDDGIGPCSALSDLALPAGTYYVRVRAATSYQSFDYRLTAVLET